ncbi:MAG: hypothetical protein HZC01_03415 [Candidatus Kerfeldbacteria bacterium]|nr:hypothetical protein [Candidatus Kerfeldbacteria bacterium]
MSLKSLMVAVIVLGGLLVVAANASALTIIPPSLEFEAPPGQTYETTVKLFNETDQAVTLYTETTNFGAAGESGRPSYRFDADPEGLSSWVTVGDGPFELGPGERVNVPLKVTPPADAEPGGHYAAVFFSDTPPTAAAGGTVSVGTKIGILLLARIPGEIVESGSIKEFYLGDKTSGINRLPVTFVTRFENTGNLHLRPTGSIEVTNMLGRAVSTLEFNPANGATLPKTIRKYETIWQKGDVVEGSGFWNEFANERNNLAIGKYTATITTDAGIETTLTDSASFTFWVFPWRVMLIWGVGIIIILVILWFLMRRYNKWIVAKAMRAQGSDRPTASGSGKPKK